jgi:dihydrofolate synthase/folylpolyglutamate synthase
VVNISDRIQPIALGLERVAEVKLRLQLDPAFPIIVVGGTNGKGSVCAMLEAMLHAAGYRIGCYTSPHLIDYNERVRIAKQPVSDDELCTSFEQIERARGDVALTYFEFGTLAAMQCFISHDVEVAILEVGLGGRLDAVNVFDSECAVVTSIDIDHTDYLGDTREKIAYEKAGIFRAGKSSGVWRHGHAACHCRAGTKNKCAAMVPGQGVQL